MNELDELERELGPTLSSTFRVCLAEPDVGAPLGEERRGSRSVAVGVREVGAVGGRARRRSTAGAVAAAVVVVGVLGVGAVIGNRDSDAGPDAPATNPQASTPTVNSNPPDHTSSPAISTTDPSASPPTGGESGDAPSIALPTFVPDGYVVDDIEVTTDSSPFAGRAVPDRVRYLRRIDGQIDARVTITVEPLEAEFDATKGSITVHGHPAQIFDAGDGISVVWAEHDRIVTVSTSGLSWDDAADVAEQTTIDAATGTAALDRSGLELADLPPAPSPDAPAFSLSYRSDADPAARLDIARRPNVGQDTVDLIEFRMGQQSWEVEPTTVHELPAIVMIPPTSEPTPLVQVQWIEGDGVWSVSGRLTSAKLIEIANGLEVATLDQARQLRAELDTELAALTELDHTTLDNGIEISIHTTGNTTGNGISAYCIRQPELACDTVVSESSLIGENQSAFARTIWIDDGPWLIGWAQGEHQPTLFTDAGSTEPVDTAVVGSLVETTTNGTFIAVPRPADDFEFSFDPDTFPVYAGTVTGAADSDLLRPPATS